MQKVRPDSKNMRLSLAAAGAAPTVPFAVQAAAPIFITLQQASN